MENLRADYLVQMTAVSFVERMTHLALQKAGTNDQMMAVCWVVTAGLAVMMVEMMAP